MGFVRTPEEIARIEDELSSARWTGEMLTLQFLTDPDTVARLLPPPLTPADEPLANVTIGRWRSSCLGTWTGAVLNLVARHDGIVGGYPLVIYMDAEPPIQFGRELFGENKKRADSHLFRTGDQVHAWVERGGVRLIDVEADLDGDLGPLQGAERYSFNFKSRTAADGHGLEEDAILTRTHFTADVHVQRSGTGRVTLTSTAHDPLAEVEVLEVRRAVWLEDDTLARSSAIARVPAEAFLPYHYGRQDDWLTFAGEPRVPA
jgi:acetoacetate decarboxylase